MGALDTPHFLKPRRRGKTVPVFLLPLSFFLIEGFSFLFLTPPEEMIGNLWPLAFGLLWAGLLTALCRVLPRRLSPWAYGIFYFLYAAYVVVQTGYYLLFQEMLWISDFRYASEGSDYFSILTSYPLSWWLGILVLAALGIWVLRRFPAPSGGWRRRLGAGLAACICALGALLLPQAVFLKDSQVRYAGSDYGRAQSRKAAYENMFNTYRLYQVCGIFQTAAKDIYANGIYPITPGYYLENKAAREEIDSYFASQNSGGENEMTGLLEGKNVILVLMESMDDWMIGEHTPTLSRLMSEGITFTNFYTPGYGGVRTFNTEFCINTGSFLSSQGGYAFDYVTNTFDQSLANLLRQEGYSALTYHYNDPSFYSRGVFSPAMGYEAYISYQDYVDPESDELYDDQLLFDNQELSQSFFREGKKLNFVITRSAHLSYKYNEVLSYWGLKKYPQYRGLTGNEETDCAYLKARLVDDFFSRMLQELESAGELDNTVIIAATDHYTYGYKDEESLLALSGVEDLLLLEKTPCFIWSAGMEPMAMDKVLNTSDLLPTVLNLLGVDSPDSYLGKDAFDPGYEGFVPFSDGSWIFSHTAYDAGTGEYISMDGRNETLSPEALEQVHTAVQTFIQINNQILETNYYG